jgi:hypothetical protein
MTVASTLDRWQWGSQQCQWQQICEMWSSRVCSQLHCLHHNESFITPLRKDATVQWTSCWLLDPWSYRHYIHSHHKPLIQQHSVIVTRSSESSIKPLWPQI